MQNMAMTSPLGQLALGRSGLHLVLRIVAIGVLAIALPQRAAAQVKDIERIECQLDIRPTELEAKVQIRIVGLARSELKVRMPAWKPGSYRILDFGKVVGRLTATGADGNNIEVVAHADLTWTLPTAGHKTVTLHYSLPLQRPPKLNADICPRGVGASVVVRVPDSKDEPTSQPAEPRKVTYRDAYAFEGPATWIFVPGRLDVPHRARFVLPEGWQIATGLQPDGDSGLAFSAPDYDVLADSPIHAGKFVRETFEVAGIKHHIILTGLHLANNERSELVRRAKRIVEAQLHMMGKPPYQHYHFLIARSPSPFEGGGLEHLNSTNIMLPGIRGGSADGVIAHEFFHLWNVKRLRPRALGPFDYTAPVRTSYLWVAEGFTSYYGTLSCVRAGLTNDKVYWTRQIAAAIDELQRNRGRLKLSVAETSRTVWDFPYLSRSYQHKAPSYYNKGQLLALLLDVEIRVATKGQKSLDDVMRGLYEQCTSQGKGFADGDLRKWCEKVSGRDFVAFFRDYVEGVVELPFSETLRKIGLRAGLPEAVATPKEDGARKRQTRRRWQVTFDEQASKEAVALREAMTRVVLEDK